MLDSKIEFPSDARLLDAGGWFKPWIRATHVVDLMPYETRGARVQLAAQPGERFTKATWRQLDFLQAELRFPYPDGYFDYAFCGHTIEDLNDPAPLLRELTRVARAGCIETPSRLTEQTAGVRDRICEAPGYDHHHWIADVADGVLELSSKTASLPPTARDHLVPLFVYEKITATDAPRAVTRCAWHGQLSWRFMAPDEARDRARNFARSLAVTPTALRRDRLIRRLRGFKRRWLRPTPPTMAQSWEQIVALSQPYSTIPLCPRSP